MASVADLLPRADALAAVVTYQTSPAAWLTNAARVAAQGTPVVVNCKGIAPDATPVIVTLVDLERLTAAAGGGCAQSSRRTDSATERPAHRAPTGEIPFLCGGEYDQA